MSLFGKKAEPKSEARVVELEPPTPIGLPSRPRYSIDDAIQLMRTLPLNQNPELVLLVVRNTLHSLNVELKVVIDDGAAKQERLRTGIASVESAIAELERDIALRRQEMGALQANLEETTSVRERLELAAQRAEPIAAPNVAFPPAPKAHGASSGRPPKPPPRGLHAATADTEDRATLDIDPMPESGPTHPS